MSVVVGFDIGGSKCAVSVGREEQDSVALLAREAFPTPKDQREAIEALCALALRLAGKENILSVGVSAGGPMDARKGVLMNPPNLLGWSGVSITQEITARLGVPAALGNDANACALAEWTWGAGRGSRTMVFLTFGTGLGAGIVIDGRILPGASDNAGELGHWRMADFGPSGYGKPGSLEGFCSGGGMAQLARTTALKYRQNGQTVGYEKTDVKTVAEAARAGDAAALEVFAVTASFLGKGLALVLDFLNPDRIVLGSIYARCRDLLEQGMREALRKEATPIAVDACQIVPALLGDNIGDYAALSLAKSVAG